jgi:SPP1 family predicted phage head-tail adaptor
VAHEALGGILRIGNLNKRINLEAQTRVADGMGGWTVAYATMASSIPAAIWPVSANETIENMQVVMKITHRIRIRYRSVLKSSWRVKFGDRYFDIVSIIDPNMAHKFLDIMCKETI